MNRPQLIWPDHFWSKVDKDGPTMDHCPELGPCWMWIGSLDKDRYGKLSSATKVYKTNRAARIAYIIADGSVPEGLEIDHLCRNRPCVRRSHLEAKTHHGNLLSSPNTLNSRNRAKTHCGKGHLYSDDNTQISPQGFRNCRTCNREDTREFYRRKNGYYLRHPEEAVG